MSGDMRAVFWKEWRSLVGGPARRQLLMTAGLLSIWALWFPIQMGGEDFVSDPVMMGILTVTFPMVIVGILVPDAIAGERERHTLGTLLASRLPDRAILFGKLGFGLIVGWIAAPLMMAVGLVMANLVALDAAPLFYDPAVLAATLGFGLLVAVLTGAIGIFVSLRASTVQEAQQLTLIGLMLPLMLAGFGTMALLANRDLAGDVIDFLGSAEAWYLIAAIMLALVVVDVILLVGADRRFRRSRLIVRGS